MVDREIVEALNKPGTKLPVVVRPTGTILPDASNRTRRGRFEGLGWLDSPAIGNDGNAVFVRSFHDPHVVGVYWLDTEVFMPGERLK